LGHPKTKRGSAKGKLIKFLLEKDTASEGYGEPDEEETAN